MPTPCLQPITSKSSQSHNTNSTSQAGLSLKEGFLAEEVSPMEWYGREAIEVTTMFGRSLGILDGDGTAYYHVS